MAFSDFLDLRTAVVETVGDSGIVDVFPRLVKLAEAWLNRNLRFREQVNSTTLTIASGSANLPSDYAEVIGVYNASGFEYVEQPLHAVKPTGYRYAISGKTLKTSTLSGDVTFEYYATVPTLTDGGMTGTNWLLSRYPDLYLYAVAFEAAKWKRDAELSAQLVGLRDDALRSARSDDMSARYSRARVRVEGCTP